MKFRDYISEQIKSKLVKSALGKVRVIEGYKNYKRLYVHKKGKMGYMVTDTARIGSIDDMILIGGEYCFGTLKQLHDALNKE